MARRSVCIEVFITINRSAMKSGRRPILHYRKTGLYALGKKIGQATSARSSRRLLLQEVPGRVGPNSEKVPCPSTAGEPVMVLTACDDGMGTALVPETPVIPGSILRRRRGEHVNRERRQPVFPGVVSAGNMLERRLRMACCRFGQHLACGIVSGQRHGDAPHAPGTA